MKYDVIIVGAGPGGIFTAYELLQKKQNLKRYCIVVILVFGIIQTGITQRQEENSVC